MLFIFKAFGCSKYYSLEITKNFIPVFLHGIRDGSNYCSVVRLKFPMKDSFKSKGANNTDRSSNILEGESNPNQCLGSVLLNEFNYLSWSSVVTIALGGRSKLDNVNDHIIPPILLHNPMKLSSARINLPFPGYSTPCRIILLKYSAI
jgi:hypothetical protein